MLRFFLYPPTQLQTLLACMSLQEGVTGVFPFKSNTFYRYFGSSSKSLKAEGGREGTTHAQSGLFCSRILKAECKRQPFPHTPRYRWLCLALGAEILL